MKPKNWKSWIAPVVNVILIVVLLGQWYDLWRTSNKISKVQEENQAIREQMRMVKMRNDSLRVEITERQEDVDSLKAFIKEVEKFSKTPKPR